MDIEGFAVGALLQRLAYTENIQLFVSLRDKEPLWDGSIYVYKGEQKTREDINRIPIQVKGKICAKRKRKSATISYSTDTVDLEVYLRDGGVIFFVVDVPDTPKRGKIIDIYYCLLLPFDLRKVLKKAGEQKTISISLELFPDSKTAIKRIISNAISDRQKQAGYSNISVEKLEEYKNIGQYSITFDVDADNHSTNILKDINTQQPYIYAIRTDGTRVPIAKGAKFTSLENNHQSTVSVKGEFFYNEYKVIFKDSGEQELYFGVGNYFIFKPKNDESKSTKNGSFGCNAVGTLEQQIHDTKFYCQAIENNGYEIDGRKCDFRLNNEEKNPLDDMYSKLTALQEFREALNVVGYTNDLPFTDFDEKTWSLVDDFKSVILEGKEKKFSKLPEGTYFCRITFGCTTLVLLVCKSEAACNIYNPYTHALPLYCEDKTGHQHPLSPFVLLDVSLLSAATYLNFDAIWQNLQSIAMSDIYHSYITHLMLRMLTAHDNSAPLAKELLDFSLRIAQWLYKTVENNCLQKKEICQLNLMQIKRRMGELSKDDTILLFSLLDDNPDMCDMNKTGLYILVDDFSKARKYFDKLSDDDQKIFLEFPIANLWIADNKPIKETESSTDNNDIANKGGGRDNVNCRPSR